MRPRAFPLVALLAGFLLVLAGTAASEEHGPAPEARFTPDCLDLTCTLDASESTGGNATIVAYNWTITFGDDLVLEEESENATLEHAFDGPGAYDITLTVRTDANETATTTEVITVTHLKRGSGQIPWSALGVGVVAFGGAVVLARET